MNVLKKNTGKQGQVTDLNLYKNGEINKKNGKTSHEGDISANKIENEFNDSNFDNLSTKNFSNSEVTRESFEVAVSSESEDEFVGQNTVGKIPMEWYQDFPHIGYDVNGKKIFKPAFGDNLEKFLDSLDNPDFGRTVLDKLNMKEIILTDEEVEMVRRIQSGTFAHADFNDQQRFEDICSKDVSIHPMTNAPEPKRRFIPSKHEHQRIAKLVRAIRRGWIVPNAPKVNKPRWYSLWIDSDVLRVKKTSHLTAPKRKLPGHQESYNPPEEYLLTDKELKKVALKKNLKTFIPHSYSCLRHVPRYNEFVKEQFERCLDLYLCPRTRKLRVHADPESLIPKLPSPKDLQPFPSTCVLVYKGHTGVVRSVAVDPTGQYLYSGSDDCTVKVWELISGRCLFTYTFSSPVVKVSSSPSLAINLLAVAAGTELYVINTKFSSKKVRINTDQFLSTVMNDLNTQAPVKNESFVLWNEPSNEEFSEGHRVRISHASQLMDFSWHCKGDYCVTVSKHRVPVFIHQLSKRRSQTPFMKPPGPVQRVAFHPLKPFLFVATQRYIRIYNLIKHELLKKLLSPAKWLSCMDIHSAGDNIIVGSYDKRLSWFDLDLSSKPYKTLRYHHQAIRAVAYHRRYPLFATCSDDGFVHVFHGRVFSDPLQNPLIVPLKRLCSPKNLKSCALYDVSFHPKQPWIIAAAADSTLRLYT